MIELNNELEDGLESIDKPTVDPVSPQPQTTSILIEQTPGDHTNAGDDEIGYFAPRPHR